MAAFSIASLLPEHRIQKDPAAELVAPIPPVAPVVPGTVVSAQGLSATISGVDVMVGDVVAISGWEAIPGPRRPGCFEPRVEAEVVAVNGVEATVMALIEGWTPVAGARVTLSRHGKLDP